MTYKELRDIVGEGKPFILTAPGTQDYIGVFCGPDVRWNVDSKPRASFNYNATEELDGWILLDWFEESEAKGPFDIGGIAVKCTCPPDHFTISAIGCKCGGI
jgi:hypothetical protein